jgi:hypothetical protein
MVLYHFPVLQREQSPLRREFFKKCRNEVCSRYYTKVHLLHVYFDLSYLYGLRSLSEVDRVDCSVAAQPLAGLGFRALLGASKYHELNLSSSSS